MVSGIGTRYTVVMPIPDMTKAMGPFYAEVADPGSQRDTAAAFRCLLEAEGLVFPDDNVQEALRLWDADAVHQRGADYLDSNGTPVPAVDKNTLEWAREVIASNEVAIANQERLDSLGELLLWSKALAVFIATFQREYQERAIFLQDGFKQLVQVSLKTERWPQAWLDIVSAAFLGEGMAFPMDGRHVKKAAERFLNDFFKEIRMRHFGRHYMYCWTIWQGLEGDERLRGARPAPREMLGSIATAAQFLHHSPGGGREVILERIKRVPWISEADWLDAIDDAVERAEPVLYNPANL